jgi:hypothetical protein
VPLNLTRRDAGVAILFLVVAVAYYFPLTVQGRVLASFDTQTYFYPNASYLASRLRLGQLPLWDPYLFAGVPFLANSQVGALYPPQWLFLLGPISSIYSLLVVGHVWLTAIGTYLLARASLRLGRYGATFAAVGLAFGGFVGGMSGHLNQLEAFAWLPFGILALERVARQRQWAGAFLAAVPFVLSALAGHSQVLFFTAILAVLAAVYRTAFVWAHDHSIGLLSRRRCAIDVSRLALGPLLAVLLASAQLLPTLELTRHSIRAHGLPFSDAAAFSLPPNRLMTILAPSIGQLPPSSEWYGWVGLSCLILAVYGLWRRQRKVTMALAVVAVVGLLLALGQYTPLYRIVFDLVPGVSLFRVPARWLAIWTVAVVFLGGIGLDSALRDENIVALPSNKPLREPFRLVLGLGGCLALLVLGAVAYKLRGVIERPAPLTIGFWIISLALILAVVRAARSRRSVAGPFFVLILVAELLVPSVYLASAESVWPEAVESARSTVTHLRSVSRGERVLAIGDNSYDPGDLAAIQESMSRTLPPAAVAQYVTSVKHVDGLTPNIPLQFGLRTIDGYDGGILPLDRYHDLKRLFPAPGRDVSDGRLRIQLVSAPATELLSWLNIRFLVMDRLRDQWIDGIFYDLALSYVLAPGDTVALPVQPIFLTSTIGVVIEQSVGRAPSGVLRLSIDDSALELQLPSAIPSESEFPDPTDSRRLALGRIALPTPVQLETLRAAWTGDEPLTLRSITLIGASSNVTRSVPVDPRLRLSYLGDMKIYDNLVARPRVFLADGLSVVPTSDAVIGRLTSTGWNAGTLAVASESDVDPGRAFAPTGGAGSARILVDDPESMVVATDEPDQKILVVTDAAYPGWRASVDGAETPILVVDVMFRGVIVPSGRHTIMFRYDPFSWRVGVILTGTGAVAWTVGLYLSSQRRKPGVR